MKNNLPSNNKTGYKMDMKQLNTLLPPEGILVDNEYPKIKSRITQTVDKSMMKNVDNNPNIRRRVQA